MLNGYEPRRDTENTTTTSHGSAPWDSPSPRVRILFLEIEIAGSAQPLTGEGESEITLARQEE